MKRFLHPGDRTEPGGLYYCGAPHPKPPRSAPPGFRCGGVLGLFAVGDILLAVLERHAPLGEIERSDLDARPCPRCLRWYVTRRPVAASAGVVELIDEAA